MAMIYTVTFAPALDYAMWLEDARPGGTNRARRTRLFVGGKGVNVSMALAELGVESVCLGFAAGFTGREIVRRLRRAGVRERMILLERGTSRINVKLKGEVETEINAEGPEADDGAMRALCEQIDALGPGDVLALSGSPPANADSELYARLVAKARAAGAEAVVDATGEQLVNALARGPLLVKPNLDELEAIAGTPVHTRERLIEQAVALKRRGAQNVLVSLGARGALLVSGTGLYRCAAPRGEARNTTGAGDAMVAAYLYARAEGLDDAKRLRLCVAAGSARAFTEGPVTGATVRAVLERTPKAARIPCGTPQNEM